MEKISGARPKQKKVLYCFEAAGYCTSIYHFIWHLIFLSLVKYLNILSRSIQWYVYSITVIVKKCAEIYRVSTLCLMNNYFLTVFACKWYFFQLWACTLYAQDLTMDREQLTKICKFCCLQCVVCIGIHLLACFTGTQAARPSTGQETLQLISTIHNMRHMRKRGGGGGGASVDDGKGTAFWKQNKNKSHMFILFRNSFRI